MISALRRLAVRVLELEAQLAATRARFDEKWMPEPTTGCYLWIGAADDSGYGQIVRERTRTKVKAHRFAWELEHGPLDDEMHVLHRCDTPACCNPAHLFVGSNHDNIVDRMEKGRTRNQFMDHDRCQRGHVYTDATVYHHGGRRHCRICRREASRSKRVR